MESLGWALIQSDCYPYNKRKLGHRHTLREYLKTQGEDRWPSTNQQTGSCCSKDQRHGRVPSEKRKKFAVAGVQCVLNTGAKEFKRYVWVEYNSILCCTEEFWPPCCT